MTKADVLAGLAAKPLPFSASDGFAVLLRPLRYGDRSDVMLWVREHKDEDGMGVTLQKKLAALSICDEAGGLVLSEAEIDGLDPLAIDAIAKEVARRSGLDGKDEPGKMPPTTTN